MAGWCENGWVGQEMKGWIAARAERTELEGARWGVGGVDRGEGREMEGRRARAEGLRWRSGGRAMLLLGFVVGRE